MHVIVLFAGINDIIHGWATSTVLRRFQWFYQHLQQKNPTAKIAIAGILPKRRNRWYAWSKEEEEQLKQENASAKIVNWRLSELSTAIRKNAKNGFILSVWARHQQLIAYSGCAANAEISSRFIHVYHFNVLLNIFSYLHVLG